MPKVAEPEVAYDDDELSNDESEYTVDEPIMQPKGKSKKVLSDKQKARLHSEENLEKLRLAREKALETIKAKKAAKLKQIEEEKEKINAVHQKRIKQTAKAQVTKERVKQVKKQIQDEETEEEPEIEYKYVKAKPKPKKKIVYIEEPTETETDTEPEVIQKIVRKKAPKEQVEPPVARQPAVPEPQYTYNPHYARFMNQQRRNMANNRF